MSEKKSNESQIEILAYYIMTAMPEFIDRTEGVGDCAIRIIKTLKSKSIPIDELEAVLANEEWCLDDLQALINRCKSGETNE